MIGALFHTLVFVPLYNALVALLTIVPFGDLGVAVIILTIIVKLILFPISLKAARTQILMKELEGPLREIRDTIKDKKEQAERTMALYREKGVNPFSSIILIFIQIPIIFGLYFVFLKGGLPIVHADLLYPYIPQPSGVSVHFLGLIDVTQRNPILALLAGISQFFQAYYALPKPAARSEKSTFQDDLARSMHLQMRYILPIMVTAIAYYISAAVALYWVTSNIFAIGQELYVRRKRAQEVLPKAS